MICPKCKKEIKDSSKFCYYCGNKITERIYSPKASTEKKIVVSKSTERTSEKRDGLTITPEASKEINRRLRNQDRINQQILTNNYSSTTSKNKNASVIGRGIAGGLIAGPAGAVVGALSAVDKNNKKKK